MYSKTYLFMYIYYCCSEPLLIKIEFVNQGLTHLKVILKNPVKNTFLQPFFEYRFYLFLPTVIHKYNRAYSSVG